MPRECMHVPSGRAAAAATQKQRCRDAASAFARICTHAARHVLPAGRRLPGVQGCGGPARPHALEAAPPAGAPRTSL